MKRKKKRRKYKRPFGQRPYRKLFILATEGSVTEPGYFSIFNNENNTIRIKCIRSGKKSDPKNKEILFLQNHFFINRCFKENNLASTERSRNSSVETIWPLGKRVEIIFKMINSLSQSIQSILFFSIY